jgi:pyruvate formate lyase activating enzyme
MKEALYYTKAPKLHVICNLCPHNCRIGNDHYGLCLNRKNEGGILYSLNYGRLASVAVDPVEKKPLYHFFPAENILSFGTSGCSFKCDFCQNASIAFAYPDGSEKMLPADCIKLGKSKNTKMIAYTYNEPYIWYEHVIECACLAKKEGIYNVLVTNGYYNKEPFDKLLPFIDAMNIDLKAFSDDFYKKYCKGELLPVLNTIKEAFKSTHVEITTLLIPGLNDSDDEIEELTDFLANISPDIPFHISKYFPRNKMSIPSTSQDILEKAYCIAKKKLSYVYVGNTSGFDSNTYCADCESLLVKRNFYDTEIKGIDRNKCHSCGKIIYGKFV